MTGKAAESNAAESKDNPLASSSDTPAHVSESNDTLAAAPPPAAAPDKQAPWLVWLQECVGGPDANPMRSTEPSENYA